MMKLQSFVFLCLVACVLAAPGALPRTGAVTTQSTTGSQPINCGPGGLAGLLGQLDNLLSNIVLNFGQIQGAGAANNNLLTYLANILTQLEKLLMSVLNGVTTINPDGLEGVLSNIVSQLSNLLDSILGAGTGKQYACTPSGILGNLIPPGLVDTLKNLLASGSANLETIAPLLAPILTPILGLLSSLISSL